jgi:NAD(P)-dependent dehydrogenase (short-subunit alcohol dehydrogenase family)
MSVVGAGVLITGAGSGIGRAAAVAFAKKGHSPILLADRDPKGGEATLQILREQSEAKAEFFAVDVADTNQLASMFQDIVKRDYKLKYAFNNAGIEGTFATIPEYPDEEFDRVMNVNVKSVFECLKHEIPILAANGGGAIVNCSSIAGLSGHPLLSAYAASKHAILGLTRTAAREVADQGIRVNAVCPGPIETPMITRIESGAYSEEKLTQMVPMHRLGKPEEVANAVVFLCSGEASYITGHSLSVDGGMHS